MKNFKNALLIISLAGLIVACSNTNQETQRNNQAEEQVDQTIEVEKSEPAEEEIIENGNEAKLEDEQVEEIPSEEIPSNEEDPIVEDDNLITKDGKYYTAYNPQSNGGVNEYNLPETNSWQIEGDKLTVNGTLQESYPDGEYTENKIHTFKLTDATTFTGVGAEGEFEMNKEDHLDQGAPSNIITVTNGVVTNISFGS